MARRYMISETGKKLQNLLNIWHEGIQKLKMNMSHQIFDSKSTRKLVQVTCYDCLGNIIQKKVRGGARFSIRRLPRYEWYQVKQILEVDHNYHDERQKYPHYWNKAEDTLFRHRLHSDIWWRSQNDAIDWRKHLETTSLIPKTNQNSE